MTDKSWKDMTPGERMQVAMEAMQNPCADGEHIFQDSVNSIGDETMLQQICKVCFTFQGWMYGKDSRD
jgi:hypothetical protein